VARVGRADGLPNSPLVGVDRKQQAPRPNGALDLWRPLPGSLAGGAMREHLHRTCIVSGFEEVPMRTLALTILTMSIALADGQARAQTYGPIYGPWAYESAPSSYCLQGRIWGYPGNCQFSSYAQCMATASGTDAYCGINPQYAFARQRRGDYRPRY
jgi:hypothetical protein